MSKTRRTRYAQSSTPSPPERPTGPLPLAPRIVLGQVTKGVARDVFRRIITEWNWDSTAGELLDDLPREQVAGALVDKFFERGLGDAIRRSLYAEWDKFRERAVDLLNNKFDTHRAAIANDDSFFVEYDEEFQLTLSFEVWGELADMDNPDERANFDYSVDDAIVRLFGHANRIEHTFKKGGLDEEFYFVWKCEAAYRFDPVVVIRNSKSGTMTLIRELAEKAAASATP